MSQTLSLNTINNSQSLLPHPTKIEDNVQPKERILTELPQKSTFPPQPDSWYCVGIDEAGRGPVLGFF
jgi:hypothetical protein